MTIIPLGERVLLKAEKSEEKTAGGIFIPQAAQEKTQIATVVAIGDSEEIKVKVGDKVLHDKYAGTEIKDSGEDYLIVNAQDILAVIFLIQKRFYFLTDIIQRTILGVKTRWDAVEEKPPVIHLCKAPVKNQYYSFIILTSN